MAHTYTYQGHEVAYDEKAIHLWSVQKALSGADGPAAMYAAIDRILCNRTDEVAASLDDDLDAMIELVNELATLDKSAKN